MDSPTGPLWSQKQAIAYEVALEAINDVIAGYRGHYIKRAQIYATERGGFDAHVLAMDFRSPGYVR